MQIQMQMCSHLPFSLFAIQFLNIVINIILVIIVVVVCVTHLGEKYELHRIYDTQPHSHPDLLE